MHYYQLRVFFIWHLLFIFCYTSYRTSLQKWVRSKLEWQDFLKLLRYSGPSEYFQIKWGHHICGGGNLFPHDWNRVNVFGNRSPLSPYVPPGLFHNYIYLVTTSFSLLAVASSNRVLQRKWVDWPARVRWIVEFRSRRCGAHKNWA